jgi:hypothetical protein
MTTADLTVGADHLNSACKALGDVAHALGARRFLAKPLPPALRQKMEVDAKPDAEIEEMAARAFEAACIALAKIGYPGVTMILCTPDETNL